MATGARRERFPPAEFQRNFDLCIVYINSSKGYTMWKALGWSFSSYYGFCQGSGLWTRFPSIFILAAGRSFPMAGGLCSVGGGVCRCVWRMRCADRGPAPAWCGVGGGGGEKAPGGGMCGPPRGSERSHGPFSAGLAPHPRPLPAWWALTPSRAAHTGGTGAPGEKRQGRTLVSLQEALLPRGRAQNAAGGGSSRDPVPGAASSAGSLLRGRRRHVETVGLQVAEGAEAGVRCGRPTVSGGQWGAWERELRDGAGASVRTLFMRDLLCWGLISPPPRRERKPLDLVRDEQVTLPRSNGSMSSGQGRLSGGC